MKVLLNSESTFSNIERVVVGGRLEITFEIYEGKETVICIREKTGKRIIVIPDCANKVFIKSDTI